MSLIARTLRGSRDKQVLELGLDSLSTYGLLKKRSRTELYKMVDHLEAEGYLQAELEYQTVFVTQKASQVLFQGEPVVMKVELEEELPPAPGEKKLSARQGDLLDVLKQLRYQLAKDAEVPAYVIFSNATLTEMARQQPQTLSQFKKISGVGEIKAAWYAEPFLNQIRSYLEENGEG